MGLSKFFVLKSDANNKFLCYDKEKGSNQASLRFSYDMSTTPQRESETKMDFHFLKFEVEEAQTGGGFVHIRTCYNNSYWVRKCEDKKTIVSEGKVAEEDQSKWSCTMFKPVILGTAEEDDSGDYNIVPPINGEKPQKIQLLHISQLEEHYVDADGSGWLEERSSASGTFTAYNVELMTTLPEYTKLIGNSVDKERFLSNFQHYLKLQANGSDKQWWLSPRGGSQDPPMLSPLNQAGPAIESLLIRDGEPAVIERQILSVEYHIPDLSVAMSMGITANKYVHSRTNNSSRVEETVGFEVEYITDTFLFWIIGPLPIMVTWPSVPYIRRYGVVEVSYENPTECEFGQTKTVETSVKYTRNISIPPRQTATLSVQANRNTLVVPFTCIARDVMADGTTREVTDTGLFIGVNDYQFRTFIVIEDM